MGVLYPPPIALYRHGSGTHVVHVLDSNNSVYFCSVVYLTNKNEHTALYKINPNMQNIYMEAQK